MKKELYTVGILIFSLFFISCKANKEKQEMHQQTVFTGKSGEIKLIILDPGHFHASLLLKFPQKQINDTVYVYAPKGEELNQFLSSIEDYNNRPENPTSWIPVVYADSDYLEKMIADKKGNVVILAGNNQKKTEYIHQSISAGYHVLSDKPMVIDAKKFPMLEAAYDTARTKGVYLYDVMTERYDVLNAISRELLKNKTLFGELESGSQDNPSIQLESVHHFYKNVSGNALLRPAWFYDVEQQGEGIVDVSTHLVDLIHWICFPDSTIDYKTNVRVLSAEHWPTKVTQAEFEKSTKLNVFPDYLQKDVKDGSLYVLANGRINYEVNHKNAQVTVMWNFEAPSGTGDTYNALLAGTKASIRINQNESTKYIEELYVERNQGVDQQIFDLELKNEIVRLQKAYPFISLERINNQKYHIVVPIESRPGHEDYFGYVAQQFFTYLVEQNMPEWEIENTLAKYYITTTALQLVQDKLID